MERAERVSRGLELVDKRCKMEKGRKIEMGCWVVVEGVLTSSAAGRGGGVLVLKLKLRVGCCDGDGDGERRRGDHQIARCGCQVQDSHGQDWKRVETSASEPGQSDGRWRAVGGERGSGQPQDS